MRRVRIATSVATRTSDSAEYISSFCEMHCENTSSRVLRDACNRQGKDGGMGIDGNERDLTTSGSPIPLFKLTPGVTASSHGIACAEVAGEKTDYFSHIFMFSQPNRVHFLLYKNSIYLPVGCKSYWSTATAGRGGGLFSELLEREELNISPKPRPLIPGLMPTNTPLS